MLISIIIPTYNRLGRLQRAIDSVLRQSYKNIELIVVDDGSSDNTLSWMKFYDDARLKVITIKHGGVARARNQGVLKSSADWLCFLDSDDVWHRHKLSEQLKFHDKNRNILISQTDDVWIRNSVRVNKMKKHEVRSGHIFKDSLRLCLLCCSSVMIQKDLFNTVGGFDEDLETCEDYDLWLRVLANHEVGLVLKKLVSKFGGHEDQLSKKYPMMDKYRLIALENLLKSGFLSLTQKQWVKEEIEFKKAIVTQGALKRQNH